MRIGLVLLVLALTSFAQERKYDELGFPITFNNDRVTRNDVVRSVGGAGTTVAPGTIQNERDRLLMTKLTERIGQLWGIEVLQIELDGQIRRQVERLGGEAKFYDWLRQRGETLAQYEERSRLGMLNMNIEYLIRNGVTPPPGRRLLPWNVKPTPEELRIAFRFDAQRRSRRQGTRVRRLLLHLELEGKRKSQIVIRNPQGWRKTIAAETKALAQEVHGQLKAGEDIFEVAKQLGIEKAEEQAEAWIKLPRKVRDPVGKFCKEGEPKTFCEPIEQPGPAYLIVYLFERQEQKDRGLGDAGVQDDYVEKIISLRRTRVLATMRLRALEKSLVRPRFVKERFRQILLAELQAAVEGLRELGLN